LVQACAYTIRWRFQQSGLLWRHRSNILANRN
jgi:hypothetical protein